DAVILVPVDLQQRRIESAITLDGGAKAMAITPQGDRIYLAGGQKRRLSVVPVGDRSPAEWFVTSDSPTVPGRVRLDCVAQSPVDRAVVFVRSLRPYEPNGVATGLSQVVPVAGPCSYDFSFLG